VHLAADILKQNYSRERRKAAKAKRFRLIRISGTILSSLLFLMTRSEWLVYDSHPKPIWATALHSVFGVWYDLPVSHQ